MSLFLKQSKYKKGLYLQIYDSYRDPSTGQSKNRCVKTLGYVQDLIQEGIADPVSHFKDYAASLNAQAKAAREREKAMKISDRPPYRCLGYFPIQAILRKLKVKAPLDFFFSQRDFQFSVSKCLEELVFARLVSPSSKKKTCEKVIPTLYEHSDFSYDQILSCLDVLGADYEKIVELFASATSQAYEIATDKVFFDCTNFYFEIDRCDEWRRKGPSKENRHDPIIGMGLLLDANKIPIGMKLYPGNESEKPVMRKIIRDLKAQNSIKGRTISVADKGLNCAQNIHELHDRGDGYIFSKSLKQLPETEKTWVLLDNDYTEIKGRSGQPKFRIKSAVVTMKYVYRNSETKRKESFTVKEQRIAAYNGKLAKKQREEIYKMVEKAKAGCFCCLKKEEFGESSKYIEFESVDKGGKDTGEKPKAKLNQKKIDEDLALAGYSLLVTSETRMEPLDVYEAYHELWRIEESFRTIKSELDARPVYVQQINKIKGHFLICYLSVLLERIFQFKILEDKFGSHQVYEFIREFKIAPFSNSTYMNMSTTSELIEFMGYKYNLPLNNLYMDRRQIKRILERNL